MLKSFRLFLKNFTVTEIHPIFPVIPHSAAKVTAINSTMVVVSQDRIFSFLKRVFLKHFGERQSVKKERKKYVEERKSEVQKKGIIPVHLHLGRVRTRVYQDKRYVVSSST